MSSRNTNPASARHDNPENSIPATAPNATNSRIPSELNAAEEEEIMPTDVLGLDRLAEEPAEPAHAATFRPQHSLQSTVADAEDNDEETPQAQSARAVEAETQRQTHGYGGLFARPSLFAAPPPHSRAPESANPSSVSSDPGMDDPSSLFSGAPPQPLGGGLFGNLPNTGVNSSGITNTTGAGAQQVTTGVSGASNGTPQPATNQESTTTGQAQPTHIPGQLGTGLFGRGGSQAETSASPRSSLFSGLFAAAANSQPHPAANQGSGLFGVAANSQPQPSTTQRSGLFGASNSSQTQAAASQGPGLFGAAATSQPQPAASRGSGLFGAIHPSQTQSSTNQGSGLFGGATVSGPQPATTQRSGLFGAPMNSQPQPAVSQGSGLFGAPTNSQPQPATNQGSRLFGGASNLQPQPAASQGSGLFGAPTNSQPQPAATQGSGLLGGATNSQSQSAESQIAGLFGPNGLFGGEPIPESSVFTDALPPRYLQPNPAFVAQQQSGASRPGLFGQQQQGASQPGLFGQASRPNIFQQQQPQTSNRLNFRPPQHGTSNADQSEHRTGETTTTPGEEHFAITDPQPIAIQNEPDRPRTSARTAGRISSTNAANVPGQRQRRGAISHDPARTRTRARGRSRTQVLIPVEVEIEDLSDEECDCSCHDCGCCDEAHDGDDDVEYAYVPQGIRQQMPYRHGEMGRPRRGHSYMSQGAAYMMESRSPRLFRRRR